MGITHLFVVLICSLARIAGVAERPDARRDGVAQRIQIVDAHRGLRLEVVGSDDTGGSIMRFACGDRDVRID
jgi:hypothetical protein